MVKLSKIQSAKRKKPKASNFPAGILAFGFFCLKLLFLKRYFTQMEYNLAVDLKYHLQFHRCSELVLTQA